MRHGGGRGAVRGSGAGAFVEFQIKPKPRLAAGERTAEVARNLRLRAGDVPDAEVVQAAVVEKTGAAADTKGAGGGGFKSVEARHRGGLHAVHVNLHEVPRGAADEGVVRPVPQRAGGICHGDAPAAADVAEVPIRISVGIVEVRLEAVERVVRAEHEGGLLLHRIRLCPKLDGDLRGDAERVEVRHLHVVVRAIKVQRAIRRAERWGEKEECSEEE